MTLAPGSDPLNRIAGITQWLAGLKYSDWMMKVSTANQTALIWHIVNLCYQFTSKNYFLVNGYAQATNEALSDDWHCGMYGDTNQNALY